MSFNWYDHLCDYYGVSPEEALQLGTRSSGRKPSLPGSMTCEPVADMTFEDIWALEKRDTVESIYKFYKDQGAWSAFRQCVRHKDLEKYHMSIFNYLLKSGGLATGHHICEYGCGVAPFVTTLLKSVSDETAKKINFKITVADLDCEHFTFAKYRLQSIKETRKMKNLELEFKTITPNGLPKFSSELDVVICFEVLEHVPSPVAVLDNFRDNMKPGGFYVENFIKHDHDDDDDDDGPDLISAREERDEYYKNLDTYYDLHFPDRKTSDDNPDITRFWRKKLF